MGHRHGHWGGHGAQHGAEAIDRIKDTASSHQRAHVVEVMGRESGYLALIELHRRRGRGRRGARVRAEARGAVEFPQEGLRAGKSHFIVVVAEGASFSAEELHEYINESEGTYDSRLTVVGHIQRGGIPTASDRILASRLGTAAVEALADGEAGVMVGIRGPASSVCRSKRW